MKKSKLTKSNDMTKIIKMFARDDQFERNGGGQFVSMNRPHKKQEEIRQKTKQKRAVQRNGQLLLYYIICIFYNPTDKGYLMLG